MTYFPADFDSNTENEIAREDNDYFILTYLDLLNQKS